MRNLSFFAIVLFLVTQVIHAQDPGSVLTSTDGKLKIVFASQWELDIVRDGKDYVQAARYTVGDNGRMRVVIIEGGIEVVHYYKVVEGTLVTDAGEKLVNKADPTGIRSQRINSAGNLKQFGLALLMYSGDNGGAFPSPDGAAGLNVLVEQDVLNPGKVYINPRDTRKAPTDTITEETTSYAYIGAGFKDDSEIATIHPIMIEKGTADNWINILFLDGHVEGFPIEGKKVEDAINYLIGRVNANGRTIYSKEFQELLLKKARAIDAANAQK